jgi:uridylate kinase
MAKDSIVISFGGSVLLSEDVDAAFFNEFRTLIQQLSRGRKVYLVVGGGKSARFYIALGRKQGFSETDLDELGIRATRVNAFFLTKLIPGSSQTIPESTEAAAAVDAPIVIMGGTTPGHSTDYVGARLAAQTHAAAFIIATNVVGVYDKDPRQHDDAKFLPEVSIDALLAQYGNAWVAAGKNMVIDGPALQAIKDHKIPTFVVNGSRLQELQHVVDHQPFRGTRILQ